MSSIPTFLKPQIQRKSEINNIRKSDKYILERMS